MTENGFTFLFAFWIFVLYRVRHLINLSKGI